MLYLPQLREILRYVPQFRDKLFVIALDGAVVEEENFRNLLLDVALLRSLRIKVALVHGCGHQLLRLAKITNQVPSNHDGTGVTDATTLQLALHAANRVTHEILEGLSATSLQGAYGNVLVAHPAGILAGVDFQHTGRVERVITASLTSMLANDLIPVIAPLGCDSDGHTYRLNSDAVAVEVARSLRAVKLIYLSASGILRKGDEPLRHLSLEEARDVLTNHRADLPPVLVSKLEHAVRAAQGGVPRVHIIDATVEEGLLAEVFSNEGIGTLVHANEYQAIRKALRKDAAVIHRLIQRSVENDELVRRSRADIERQVADYFVFEVDGNPVACAAVHFYPDTAQAELAAVCVDAQFENQGIGGKLTQYGEALARAAGARQLFCLSTQAFNYFLQKAGFQVGSPDDLPAPRRDRYNRSGRRSMVLVKPLTA